MKVNILVISAVFLALMGWEWGSGMKVRAEEKRVQWWPVQAVDTMKYSRDVAREKLNDEEFAQVIDDQVKEIADLGATHVAIGTPYDEEFLPFLRLWVQTARGYGLNVWFRGNWSGWEGWFGYDKINRDEHLSKTKDFILQHGELFADGDIFDGCPECENGGPGDPRWNGDVKEHRAFLIEEYGLEQLAFKQIGKQVRSVYSMNGDVARLIMNAETTKKLGGVVTVDHYVATPEKLVSDVEDLIGNSQGQVLLGETGVPVKDIHGDLSEESQGRWLNEALRGLSGVDGFMGMNYWVNRGGSTALWRDDGQAKLAVQVLKSFYEPRVISGRVVNEWGQGVGGAQVVTELKQGTTDGNGEFKLAVLSSEQEFGVTADGYLSQTVQLDAFKDEYEVKLLKESYSWWEKVWRWFYEWRRGGEN